ncbi:MAG: bifunctional riboflavin kinase/FAD synthetase [Thermodesulfobacteriota bacterium]
MEVIYDPKKPLGFSTSAAIGNFDGVHLGHKKIINLLKKISSKKSSRSCIITFEPHPQKVLSKKEVSLIVPFEDKIRLLEKLGVDVTVCLKFTKELSKLSAEDFVKEILVKLLQIKDIVVGPDFMFGNKRSGNAELLQSLGKTYDYETKVLEPKVINNEIISSSLIRSYISEGNIQRVNELLGYRYFIHGNIVEGEKRGRQIGFPTTNINSSWELLPKGGVYATYAFIDDKCFQSITNIGYRPTFGQNKLLIETHIFDFSKNVYGSNINIEFVKRLRDEIKFNSVDDLIAQIKLDIKDVKNILTNNE